MSVEIIAKLNKLKNFVERDCGNETINAIGRMIDLIEKYKISPNDFKFTPHESVKKYPGIEKLERFFGSTKEEFFADLMRKMREETARKNYEDIQTKEREARERREKAEKEERQKQNRYCAISEDVTISHLDSKKITIALLNKMGLSYSVKGWKVRVDCSEREFEIFNCRLNSYKEAWRARMERANEFIINEINSMDY